MKTFLPIGLVLFFGVTSISYSNPVTGFVYGVIISEMRKGAEQDRKDHIKERNREMRRDRARDRRDTGGGKTVRDRGNKGTMWVDDATY